MPTLNINLNNVQPLLVSGTNIKTINGNSLLGSGDVVIGAGMAIGDQVTGATANRVLYVDSSGNLANAAGLQFNGTELGVGGAAVSGRKAQIVGTGVTDKLVVLKSVASQTGNHFESRHSDDTIQSKMRFNGNWVLGGDFNEFNGNRETLLTLVPNGTQGFNAIAITDGGSNYLNFRMTSIYTSTTLRLISYQTSPYTELLIGASGVSIGKDSVSAASASLHVYGRATNQVTMKVQAIASQTTAIFQALNSAGTRLIEFTYNGGVIFAEMLDGSASNSTMYYSLTSNKLVYKDSGGTVNALY